MINTFFKSSKNLVGVFLLLLTISISSCELFDNATKVKFDMEFNSEVKVPPSSGLNLPFDLFTPNITTNSESTFGVQNTQKELVETVNLTSMVLTITSPSSQRFDFLKDITLYINADGLGETEIAFAKDVPDNIGTELELTVTGNNLRDYIVKDKFTIRVETVTDKTVNQEIKIDLGSKFHIIADVL
jgi:hypothetical protein